MTLGFHRVKRDLFIVKPATTSFAHSSSLKRARVKKGMENYYDSREKERD